MSECIFIGYSDESKGYRLYDKISKKVIISRDVFFMEGETKLKHDAKGNNDSNNYFTTIIGDKCTVSEQTATGENNLIADGDCGSDLNLNDAIVGAGESLDEK